MENNCNFAPTNSNQTPIMDFKETLKRYGFNVTSMAQAMGLSQQNLQAQIARGSINHNQLQQMADICGVPLGEFLGLQNELVIKYDNREYVYKFEKLIIKDE